jgi:hypothetical protein
MQDQADVYLADLRHQIRDTMQIVKLQFDIMNEAVDKCGDIAHPQRYVECAEALKNAKDQIKIFQERSNDLAVLITMLDSYIQMRQQQ